MAWKVKKFDTLTATEFYAMMRLRSEVFVVEQECVYLDADGYDDRCLHLWKEVHGATVAYTRISRCLLQGGLYRPGSRCAKRKRQ